MEELKDELNGLIDVNGKVKEGYEDRANFIINELSEALGVEQEDLWNEIATYGKLGETIDEVMEKKKAEAILSANEEAYTEAITNKVEALKEWKKNLSTSRTIVP